MREKQRERKREGEKERKRERKKERKKERKREREKERKKERKRERKENNLTAHFVAISGSAFSQNIDHQLASPVIQRKQKIRSDDERGRLLNKLWQKSTSNEEKRSILREKEILAK